MFRVLVDTCVWLDLAKDSRQHAVLGVVEEMIEEQLISLLVPAVVLEEFTRNRDRIERDSAKSLSSHFKLVKDAIGKAGGNSRRIKSVLAHLDDMDHKIPITVTYSQRDSPSVLCSGSWAADFLRSHEPDNPTKTGGAQETGSADNPLADITAISVA